MVHFRREGRLVKMSLIILTFGLGIALGILRGTKMLKVRIASAGFLGILWIATAAQQTKPSLVRPTKVTVKASESQTLVPGQKFSLNLVFDPTPSGYKGGYIELQFEKADGPPVSDRYSTGESLQIVDAKRIPLIDDKSVYDVDLDITELMSPGKWELKAVVLGRVDPEPVPFVEQVSFEIPPLQPMAVHLRGAPTAEAGQLYDITATLAKFPPDVYEDGCERYLYVYADHVPPGARQVQFGPLILVPGRLSYKFPHTFEPDFPGGPLLAGVRVEAHSMQDAHDRGCRYPPLEGDLKFRFEIVPSKTLVRPTSVKVTVNPSQVELLQREIARLNTKLQNLTEQLRSKNAGDRQGVLRRNVDSALTELAATEEAYKKEGKEPSYTPVIEVFFGDIQLTYNEALNVLTYNAAQAPRTEPWLIYANAVVGDSSPRSDASEAVLKSIERNISAYQIAVSSRSLLFNLEVRSEPEQNAAISYRRGRGKPFVSWPGRTDSTLENRERAFYTIRLQKSGYGDQCIDFDAMSDTRTSITVQLTRENGCAQ